MKTQDYMASPQITNPRIMEANENDPEELPDKESKRTIVSIFKQFKGDMNVLSKNKGKEMNEVRKSIQDMKIEIEFLQKTQNEIMLEMKNVCVVLVLENSFRVGTENAI